jgi:hypothetical protein
MLHGCPPVEPSSGRGARGCRCYDRPAVVPDRDRRLTGDAVAAGGRTTDRCSCAFHHSMV